jgi:hypothetical protein
LNESLESVFPSDFRTCNDPQALGPVATGRARTPKEQPPLVASIVIAHTPKRIERLKRWRAITGRDE